MDRNNDGMNQLEELLQERLEMLESGWPLSDCLTDLSEDLAAMVRLAAEMRTVPASARSADQAAAQRSRLLQAAKRKGLMATDSPQQVSQTGHGPRQNWKPAMMIAGSLLAVAICGTLVLAGVGFAVWRGLPGQDNADIPPAGDQAFVAGSGEIEASGPDSAALNHVQGLVEVQEANGAWRAATSGEMVRAGQAVRTGALSRVELAFYDDSIAQLGPSSELRLDIVDAQTSGARTIVLTQTVGESHHSVAHSDIAGSRYEVNTPSGMGAAKGTEFAVIVTLAQITRINVDEGAVAVTAMNVTVVVVAGESTSINPGSPPTAPTLRITGEGEVTQTGGIWTIAGQTFLTDASTVIVGNPQVGDWAAIEGRFLPDGTRFADRIVLIHRTPENGFALSGTVDAMSADNWTISGQPVQVDANTAVEEGIEIGDMAAARGVILDDGTMLAEAISLLDDEDDQQTFQFTGVVESSGDSWVIGGVTVEVDQNTEIDSTLAPGDVATVEGVILSDGTWLARSIEAADEDESEFEFSGIVESMDPWVVSGVAFETNDHAEIEGGIEVGDRVSVKGLVRADGVWVAEEISLIDEQALRFEIVGEVSSTNPWIVAGASFTADDQTQISDGIEAGDIVRVTGHILPNGTLVAETIRKLDDDEGIGCLDMSAIVRSVENGQIVLLNWQTIPLDDEFEADHDELQTASVIIIRSCAGEDGHISIINIIIIYQLDALPTPPPSLGGGDDDHDGDHDDDEEEGDD